MLLHLGEERKVWIFLKFFDMIVYLWWTAMSFILKTRVYISGFAEGCNSDYVHA